MRTKLFRAAIVLALVVAAFGGGYTLGTLRMFRWMIESLSAETRGNLSQRVEALARLRTGDEAGAIEILERAVDTAATTLPQGRPFSELSSETQAALRIAKAYRVAYPPKRPSEELSVVLNMVPLPEAEYCSPALRKLLQSARDIEANVQ